MYKLKLNDGRLHFVKVRNMIIKLSNNMPHQINFYK
jgi:hypothetical protein